MREGNFHIDSGYRAAVDLLKAKTPIDAVFSNDEMGVGAMRAVKEANLRIPEDISIFGFDNLAISEQVEPALSTVKVNYDLMGRIAVRKIIENTQCGQIVPLAIVLPAELIIRSSTRREPEPPA